MLKEKYKTTPLYQPSESDPLEIRVPEKPTNFRFFQVTKLLMAALWRTRFGKVTDEKKGQEWRFFFESLGGLWVKVGQLVAMRSDIYEKEFTQELAKLHYRVPCFPYSDVLRIIEEKTNKKIGEIFSDFQEIPIAAASLAQVHKARLKRNGKWVAVKVQRPYAQEFLKKDMAIIRKMFNFFKNFEAFEPVLLDEMFWELETMLTEEIDFRYEVINLREAKKRFKKYGVYVPDVYRQYSSDKVVVMEFIQGITMSEYIATRRKEPERLQNWLKENKIKPKKVGSFLLHNAWRQVMEDNYFHGDLQPGNIMLLAKSRVAFIDLGSVGSTDDETLSFYRQQLIAIGQKNYLKAADFSILTSPNIPSEYQNEIRQSIVRGLRGALMKASLTDVDIEQKTTVHNASSEMSKELAKYKVSPNWGMLKLIRTFLTIDPSVVNLNPKMDLQKEWNTYYNDARGRLFRKQINSLLELPVNLVDAVSLFMKMQRKKATDFKAKIHRGVQIAIFFLELVEWGGFFVIFLFLWTYVYQKLDVIDFLHEGGGNWFTRLSEQIPTMHHGYWTGIAIASLLFMNKFRGFMKIIKQPVK
ncbi:MAG: ABC1 kinase family protein [Bacteroidia bacterium]